MGTPVKLKARGVAASLVERAPASPVRPLAMPPAGSGLKPVMGDTGVPVVGHTLDFLHDGLRHARDYHQRLGTVFWVNALGGRWVNVLGPDGLETVLVNRDRAFSNKLGWDPLIGAFFDRGVMLMDFEEHRHHRRIMQQAFKHERLVAYLDKMNPAITRGLSRWRPGGGFQLYPAAKQLTLDIATEVFMGAEANAEADRLNAAFIDVVVGGQAIIRADVPGGKWHRGLESRRRLEQYFRSRLGGQAREWGGRPVQRPLPGRDRGGRAVQRRGRRQPHDLHDDGRARHEHDHGDDDGLLPRPPSRVAGAAARGVAGAGQGRDRIRRPRRAALDGPRVQGDAADERARRHRRPPRDQGHGDRRSLHPRRQPRDGRRLRHPADGALVAATPTRSTPSGSATRGARTPRTSTPGRRSAAACTSASACTSARWRSRRSCTSSCCATRGACPPATSRSSITGPARSRVTDCRSSCGRSRVRRVGRHVVPASAGSVS